MSDMESFPLAHRSGSRLQPNHVCRLHDSVPRPAASCQYQVLLRAVKSVEIWILMREQSLTVFDALCHVFLLQAWWMQTVREVLLWRAPSDASFQVPGHGQQEDF